MTPTVQLILALGAAIVLLGTGIGGGYYAACSRGKPSLPPAKPAPALTDSQTTSMPWVLKEVCTATHLALGREIADIKTDLGEASHRMGKALDGVARLEGALGTSPRPDSSAPVRRGGSAGR